MSAAVAPAPPPATATDTKYLTGVLTSPPVVTLTAYIPTSCVGGVIGRKGQKVEDLQRRAAKAATTRLPVRVSVVGHDLNPNAIAGGSPYTGGATSHLPLAAAGGVAAPGGPTPAEDMPSSSSIPHTYSGLDFSDPALTPVVIRADIEAALAAGKCLLEACKGKLDAIVLDIPLARHRHTTVLGQDGMTVAKLSADHNVRIMVPHHESGHNVVQLEGDLGNVQKCLLELLQIASRKPGDATLSTSVIAVWDVSKGKMRLLRKTRCTIKKISIEVDGKEQWQILISASKREHVQAALAICQKWTGLHQANARKGSSGPAEGGKGKASTPSPQNSTKTGKKKDRHSSWTKKHNALRQAQES